MLSVTNNMATHLVIPGGLAPDGTLKLKPHATVNVDEATDTLRDAASNGLVTIRSPKVSSRQNASPLPVIDKPEAARNDDLPVEVPSATDDVELIQQIMECIGQGMTQKATGRKLGLTRDKVYLYLRRERQRLAAEEQS